MLAPLLASQEYKDAGSAHNKPRPVFPQIAILLDGESRLRAGFFLVRRFPNYAQNGHTIGRITVRVLKVTTRQPAN